MIKSPLFWIGVYLFGGFLFHHFRLFLFRRGYFRFVGRGSSHINDLNWWTRKLEVNEFHLWDTHPHIVTLMFWTFYLFGYFCVWCIAFPLCQLLAMLFVPSSRAFGGFSAALDQKVVDQTNILKNQDRGKEPIPAQKKNEDKSNLPRVRL